MYFRSTKTIIFELGVCTYVRVATTIIFDQDYVTEHNFIMNDIIDVGY